MSSPDMRSKLANRGSSPRTSSSSKPFSSAANRKAACQERKSGKSDGRAGGSGCTALHSRCRSTRWPAGRRTPPLGRCTGSCSEPRAATDRAPARRPASGARAGWGRPGTAAVGNAATNAGTSSCFAEETTHMTQYDTLGKLSHPLDLFHIFPPYSSSTNMPAVYGNRVFLRQAFHLLRGWSGM